MGTRSTIKFYQKDSKEENKRYLGAIYQQYDGYPEGVGFELALFLNKIELINGIQRYDAIGIQANGMGCMVAQFIKLAKKQIGGVYMTTEDDFQEWNYTVSNTWGKNDFDITIESYDGIVFEGNKEMFLQYCGGTLDMVEPPDEEGLATI